MNTRFQWIFGCAAGLLLLHGLAGCGGGGMASELSAQPEARPLSRSSGNLLRLPADDKFSIALAPAQKAPGINGKAEASASAERSGVGDASARVENGGTASATFQVGHALKNDSNNQLDLVVRTRFNYEYAAGAQPAGETEDATLSLNLYARDGKNRLLKTLTVLAHSTAEGDVKSKDRKEAEFTLTLGPGDSVSVFVGGTVMINTKEGRSADGSIKLSGLEMDVESKVAPTVAPASAPTGAAVP
ncbi:MAG: hypothetical protein IT450_05455 [Phycisphaerales bacterium]|nr:hypothetical protein [Phycisphaerales bacterium]